MPSTNSAAPDNTLLQGTLDLLILKTLSWGPRHGYAIARWIEEITDDSLQVQEGSLYPALYRLKQRRWVSVSWGRSELGRRIKLYELTTDGRAQLKSLTAQWGRCVVTMSKVLEATR
jgi:PadR family transcriptional regulator PadR